MCADLATEKAGIDGGKDGPRGRGGGGGDRVAKLIVLAEEIRENNTF